MWVDFRAVVALHHDLAVVLEAHEDGERRIAVKNIGVVVRRHVVIRLGEGRNLHIDVDAKRLPDVDGGVSACSSLVVIGATLQSTIRRITPKPGSLCKGPACKAARRFNRPVQLCRGRGNKRR